ncbi:MAG: hypothetical protein HYV63_11265 [Candidatus Schekmanbacteria bacterium]|nr:hypothetical protein [Candidatus Schekmanbacteria bacterium]
MSESPYRDAIAQLYDYFNCTLSADDPATKDRVKALMQVFARSVRILEHGDVRVSGRDQLHGRIEEMVRYHESVKVTPMVLEIRDAAAVEGREAVEALYGEMAYLIPRRGKRLFRTSLELHQWERFDSVWRITGVDRRMVNVFDAD